MCWSGTITHLVHFSDNYNIKNEGIEDSVLDGELEERRCDGCSNDAFAACYVQPRDQLLRLRRVSHYTNR